MVQIFTRQAQRGGRDQSSRPWIFGQRGARVLGAWQEQQRLKYMRYCSIISIDIFYIKRLDGWPEGSKSALNIAKRIKNQQKLYYEIDVRVI